MSLQAARVNSLTIAADGLQAKEWLSFKTGVFGAIEPPKAVRRALWDKNENSTLLSSKKIVEVVPAFVPEADETRHSATWRHPVRDGAENWVQLE